MATPSLTRRRALQLGTLLTLGLPLTACTPESQPEPQTSAEAETSRTFTFAQAAHVLTLDPLATTRIESHRISAQILEPLLKADPNTGLPQPGLASTWEMSDDQLTYTFTLASGISLSNGTPVTASTVITSIDRWKKISEGPLSTITAPVAYLFKSPAEDSAPLVSSYQADGDTTLTITLSRPSVSFLQALTQPACAIVAPEIIGPDGLLTQDPIGTGPYLISSKTDGDITLTLNPHYRGEQPEITELTFVTIPDAEKRYYHLLQGTIDAYDQVGLKDYVPLALEGYPVQSRDPFCISYITINMSHPAFDDARVRRALARAIDRSKIVADYYPQGTTAARDFVPALFQTRNEDIGSAYSYAPETAQSLLRASTYANQPIDFYYPTNVSTPYLPSPEAIYSIISANLVEAGFNIVPKPYSWADDRSEDIASTHPNYGLELTGLIGTYRDPAAFLTQVLAPAASAPASLSQDGPAQATASASPTPPQADPSPTDPANEPTRVSTSYRLIYQAIQEADTLADLAERREAYRAINASMADYLSAVPLAYPVSGVVEGPRVHRYSVNATTLDDFATVQLTQGA